MVLSPGLIIASDRGDLLAVPLVITATMHHYRTTTATTTTYYVLQNLRDAASSISAFRIARLCAIIIIIIQNRYDQLIVSLAVQ